MSSTDSVQIPVSDALLRLKFFSTVLQALEEAMLTVKVGLERGDWFVDQSSLDFAKSDVAAGIPIIRPILIKYLGEEELKYNYEGQEYDVVKVASVDNLIPLRIECVRHLRSLVLEVIAKLELFPDKKKVIECSLVPEKSSSTAPTVNAVNSNVIMNSEGSTINQTTIKLGDTKAFTQALKRFEVDDSSIEEVLSILKEREDSSEQEGMKKRLQEWVHKMCGKILDETWTYGVRVGLNKASNSLLDLLGDFLGFSL